MTRGGAAKRNAGFTLMEMLVVLAILALVAGMASQLTRPASPRLRIEAAARALCAAARATRTRAIATNSETTLTVDLARKSFFSPAVAETAFPPEARVELSVARIRGGSAASGAITFFPGGGSTGGDIVISYANLRAAIGVNWLTGETTCDLT
jgi:general secretion pathway protein H